MAGGLRFARRCARGMRHHPPILLVVQDKLRPCHSRLWFLHPDKAPRVPPDEKLERYASSAVGDCSIESRPSQGELRTLSRIACYAWQSLFVPRYGDGAGGSWKNGWRFHECIRRGAKKAHTDKSPTKNCLDIGLMFTLSKRSWTMADPFTTKLGHSPVYAWSRAL